jgi:hypothetical protein
MRRRSFLVLVPLAGLLWCQRYSLQAAPMEPLAALTLPQHCGDGICQTDTCDPQLLTAPGDGCEEDQDNCPGDCGYCGDGTCNIPLEDSLSCPADCPVIMDVDATRQIVFPDDDSTYGWSERFTNYPPSACTRRGRSCRVCRKPREVLANERRRVRQPEAA